ncbi:MAG: sigma-70 family RNA polymerase sigma factor [Synechococcales bacterium]|nr:sigma-70 family RNA polymerase sigma factor [Synechococcales bacterium]
MQRRQSLLEVFSTFVQFKDDRFHHWATDPKLRRNMEICRQQATNSGGTELSDDFWVLYWHKRWQTQADPLPQGHLSAYLQEVCYWSAQKVMTHTASAQYKLSDCFQIAIADLPNTLRGYSSHQGASLKAYANLSFSNRIRDVLRQHREANSRTDWGLLRKCSQKQLTEALQSAGLSPDAIACHRLAWMGYKTYYAPSEPTATRQLARPDASVWEAIAVFYNTQRPRQLPQGTPALDGTTAEAWLKSCARYLRTYLNPQTFSLNVTKFDEAGSGEFLDDLPDGVREAPMTALLVEEELQERQQQRSHIATVLTAALEQLDPQIQTILDLYYRQGLTQQQMAAQLLMKQYTISRRLSSARDALLLSLARWSQDTLHITVTSPVLKQMSIVLEEWLQAHYQNVQVPIAKDVFP